MGIDDELPLFTGEVAVLPGAGGSGGTPGANVVAGEPVPVLGIAVNEPPAGMGAAGEASSLPSGPPDASAPPAPPGPSGEADSGIPDADLPGPPEVPACVGHALNLDGASYAVVPRVVDNDFTLEAWIKTSQSLPGPSAFNGRAIFDADVIGGGAQDDFAVTVLEQQVAFAVGGPDTTVRGLTVVTNDEWVHLAVTRRAATGQLQVFVNGVLEGVVTAANQNPLTGRPELAFGGFAVSRKFIGSLDELRIWNVVRSGAQISANLRERLNGSEAGLVGYYTFEDQGTVQTADASPRRIPATLTGTATYVTSSALCPPGSAP